MWPSLECDSVSTSLIWWVCWHLHIELVLKLNEIIVSRNRHRPNHLISTQETVCIILNVFPLPGLCISCFSLCLLGELTLNHCLPVPSSNTHLHSPGQAASYSFCSELSLQEWICGLCRLPRVGSHLLLLWGQAVLPALYAPRQSIAKCGWQAHSRSV